VFAEYPPSIYTLIYIHISFLPLILLCFNFLVILILCANLLKELQIGKHLTFFISSNIISLFPSLLTFCTNDQKNKLQDPLKWKDNLNIKKPEIEEKNFFFLFYTPSLQSSWMWITLQHSRHHNCHPSPFAFPHRHRLSQSSFVIVPSMSRFLTIHRCSSQFYLTSLNFYPMFVNVRPANLSHPPMSIRRHSSPLTLYSSNCMYYVHTYPILYSSNHMYVFFKIIYRFLKN